LVIAYSSHAKQKLVIRRISREDVESVITHPAELFEDTEHGCEVSVGRTDGKVVVAVYEKLDKDRVC
jgi:hypothetical protein